ncbi:ATP-binding protein [Aquincola sp. MAHUQ-54]|uniref:Virulence sensor protein BvgS n=1 Tax=Aquincola agrisoli TaxID=3119538 RepID=A0AAW9QEE9_9BURK
MVPQKIFRIRREYNSWVADESMEDYALRYTPLGFRKWSEWRVAHTALGAVSFLALEAIGAAIALKYGFSNALWAIVTVALITFLTGLPISYYAARHGLDMDLLTRGAGFGYMGSTITSLIYAGFTFIFFALESAILAVALQMVVPLPLSVLYVLCSLLIVPMVVRGITLISRLQVWTQPLWAVLLVMPYLVIWWKQPQAYVEFTHLAGSTSGSSGFDPLMFGAAATVAFSLVVQIGEQVDFLRFMPERTAANRVRWWAAVVLTGPGWIVPGMLKMLGGAFLAFLVLGTGAPASDAMEPTQMYLAGFAHVFSDPAWVLAATVVFVVVSQVKINLTNAYAGSLAWSNFFARLTHSHPGRVVWLVFNVLIAVLLMALGVFQALDTVLGFYANVAVAWIGALVADLVVNKPLGLSPKGIEFKRGHLYDINPVGLGAMGVAAAVAMVAHVGLLGPGPAAFSPFIALGLAFVLAPAIALATRGRYYVARSPAPVGQAGEPVLCSVCEKRFESEDMTHCPAYEAPICSLCCTLESRCHDRCKTRSRAVDQMERFFGALLPAALTRRVNFHLGHYMVVLLSLCALGATVLGMVYIQESTVAASAEVREALASALWKVAAMLLLLVAVSSWWVALGSEARHLAQEDSNRQNELLAQEVVAHQHTAAALRSAKDEAEAASQAKTRYVAGISHELRTPLNSILGYAQILLKSDSLPGAPRDAVQTIQRSGEHLVGLVDELLDLARIEADRLQLEPMPLSLPGLLEELVRMVRPQAEAKGLRFLHLTSGSVPAWVLADGKRLRQVLINLIGNAIRFTDAGSVTLHVDCRQAALRFDIADSGIGIAPQDLRRIFEPFERGAVGRRRGEPGAGLGLAITEKLVALMGGRLAVQSTPGLGSTFSVEVPLPPADAPGPEAPEPHRIIGYEGPRRSVLVVDDQAVQRQMLAGMLAPLGFTVREAASGAECLDELACAVPDLLLLDIGMAPMDGWQTAARIRWAGHALLPIVLVSADLYENQPQRLRAASCQGFIGKPVRESQLLHTLQSELGLAWVQAAAPPEPVPPPRAIVTTGLPADVRTDLLRLARMGHAQGLHQALDQLAAGSPALAGTCEGLRGLVSRYELAAFQAMLREDPRETRI